MRKRYSNQDSKYSLSSAFRTGSKKVKLFLESFWGCNTFKTVKYSNKMAGNDHALQIVRFQCHEILVHSLVLVACRMIVNYCLPKWVGFLSAVFTAGRLLVKPDRVFLEHSQLFAHGIRLFVASISFVLGVGMFFVINLMHNINLSKDPPTNFPQIKNVLDSNPTFLTVVTFYYPIDVMFISGIIVLKYTSGICWLLFSKNIFKWGSQN